jgi:transposase
VCEITALPASQPGKDCGAYGSPIVLSEEEAAVLRQWAKQGGRLAARATAVLAMSHTNDITQISRLSRLSRSSVYLWQERFRSSGLKGLAQNVVAVLTSAQKRELESLQTRADRRLARRAAFILELSKTPEIGIVARRSGVSVNAAREWLRAFKQDGAVGLAGGSRAYLRPLSVDESVTLRRWAAAGRAFSRRARIILMLAAGDSFPAVAAQIGITIEAASYWRRAFRKGGLKAVGPKHLLEVSVEQRLLLLEAQNGSDAEISRRASLILDLTENGDIASAAEQHNVSSTSARVWTRAFQERGIEGLRAPAAGRQPKSVKAPPSLPVVSELRLPVDVWVQVKGKTIALSGVTTVLSSHWLSVSFDSSASMSLIENAVGIIADVHWPDWRHEGVKRVLQIKGLLQEFDCRSMRIKVHRFAFGAASQVAEQ